MITLLVTLMALLWHITYNVVTIKLFGIPQSISQSFYLWRQYGKSKGKILGRYFNTYCCGLAFFAGVSAYHLAPSELAQLWAILASFGLIMVGAAPDYEEEKYTLWHYIGAGISAVFAGLYLSELSHFNLGLYIICIVLCIVFSFLMNQKHNILYWIEQGCFIPYLCLILIESIRLW